MQAQAGSIACWIGHDITVSARYYLQVPEELYEKASAPRKAETATKSDERGVALLGRSS